MVEVEAGGGECGGFCGMLSVIPVLRIELRALCKLSHVAPPFSCTLSSFKIHDLTK